MKRITSLFIICLLVNAFSLCAMDSDGAECPICYEQLALESGNVSIAPCGQPFHSACILQALKYNPHCPMCRGGLTAESMKNTTRTFNITRRKLKLRVPGAGGAARSRGEKRRREQKAAVGAGSRTKSARADVGAGGVRAGAVAAEVENARAGDAVQMIRRVAEQGHAKAQYNLGVCYQEGEGVEVNLAQAVTWFRRAARQDNAMAQFYLGNCYLNGKGVDRNEVQAAEWFRRAAELALPAAQYNLGTCYVEGNGVERNLEQAVKWYMRAKRQGLEIAKDALALLGRK